MNRNHLTPCEISGCHFKEELINSITHGLGVLASIIGLVCLLHPFGQHLTISQTCGYLIYGISMIILFCASSIYHGLPAGRLKLIFKMIDHCAIYLLIAGSYTPLLLVTLDGLLANLSLIVIWMTAFIGIAFKLRYGDRFEKLSLLSYLGMGWYALILIGELWQKLPPNGFNLLIAGGLTYSLGAIFYAIDRIPYNHAIWHMFVLGGASCHYFMVLYYIEPMAI